MNWIRRCIGLALLALLVVGGTAVMSADEVTWKGSYIWDRGDSEVPGDIEAVFTPAGEDSWDVMFHFEWEGEMRAWKGEAQGNLMSGKLEGQGVEERDRKRTFVFNGTVKDGVFSGEHGSMREGELNTLGTITLSAP